jgi:hypothetical protein
LVSEVAQGLNPGRNFACYPTAKGMSASKNTQQSTQAHPGSDLGNPLLVA